MLKINIILFLLFIQTSLCAQENEYRDSLVLVKESRIAYCNGKIQQVAILTERILLKDSASIILLNRVENKGEQISSLNRDAEAYKEQITTLNNEKFITSGQVAQQKTEIKQLKKRNFVQKIGLIGLSAITLWVLIKP